MSKQARIEELKTATKTTDVGSTQVEPVVEPTVATKPVATVKPISSAPEPKGSSKMTVAKLHAIVQRQKKMLDDVVAQCGDFVDVLGDHEKRISALEDLPWQQHVDPVSSLVQEPVQGPAPEPMQKADPDPEPVKEPVIQTDAATCPSCNGYGLTDGPHCMWQWWDYQTKIWCGPCLRVNTALAAVGGDTTQVRQIAVWIRGGNIDRVLNSEEIEKYLP